MISKKIAEEVLGVAVSTGADFAELFGEISRNNNVFMVDGKIERASDNVICGVGIRAFWGTRTVFASTTDISREGLIRCARSVAAAMGECKGVGQIVLRERMIENIHPAAIIPSGVDARERAA